MSLELKYYKFVDPYTKTISKDVGWSCTRTIRELIIKGATVHKDGSVTKTSIAKPRYIDLEEITKEEYDSLDTKGESATVQIRREANIDRYNRFSDQEQKAKAAVSTEEILNKFAAIHSKK